MNIRYKKQMDLAKAFWKIREFQSLIVYSIRKCLFDHIDKKQSILTKQTMIKRRTIFHEIPLIEIAFIHTLCFGNDLILP